MSYLRDKTRPQGDRPIHHKQNNYGGGLNFDYPATDIDSNEVIGSENYIWFEPFGHGRSGSVEVADLPEIPVGTDPINSHLYHQGIKSLLLHQEEKIWRWNGAVATEIVDFNGGSLSINEKSTLKAFGKNALLFTSRGVFFILVEESNYSIFFKFNNSFNGQPRYKPSSDEASTTSPYVYKYTYTFCVIIDIATGNLAGSGVDRHDSNSKIIYESPPMLPIDNIYYSIFRGEDPIAANNINTIEINSLESIPSYINYGGFYRTLDLGKNGLNNIGIEQFAWVGDGYTYLSIGSFDDNIPDSTIEGRIISPEFTLQSVGFSPIPNGEVGEVTNTFVFSAPRNSKFIYYSQRVNDNLCGFYNSAYQTEKFDDGIQILAGTPDLLSVICNRKTYIGSLTSFTNIGFLESVISLNHFTLADSQIGVRDYGSFAEVESGTYIAVCSDSSVRSWDGSQWSPDKSINKINKIITQVDEGISTGIYYDGSYYLWLDISNSGQPTQCFRLSLKKQSGKGWTEYTGDDWIFTQKLKGSFIADNFLIADGLGIDFLFAIDRTDNKIYWIETFDGRENVQINGFDIREYYADKVSSAEPNGFNVKCRVRVKEMTGELEAWNLIHQESHGYMRDLVDATTNITPPPIVYPDLKVDARAYINGSLVDINTSGEVNPGNDIHFDYRVEGSRIAIEFESNRSGHQFIGSDTRFRVQDILRWNRGQSVTVSANFQSDFQQDLKLWLFTRPFPTATLNRVNGLQFSRNNAIFVPSPDIRNQGVGITVNNYETSYYKINNTTVFDAFTFNAWIKTPILVPGAELIIVKFNGTNPITFTLNSALAIITPEGTGSVTIEDPDTATGNVNGWSQIIFVRDAGASTINVYQNDTFKGTLTFVGTFGGSSIEIGGVV